VRLLNDSKYCNTFCLFHSRKQKIKENFFEHFSQKLRKRLKTENFKHRKDIRNLSTDSGLKMKKDFITCSLRDSLNDDQLRMKIKNSKTYKIRNAKKQRGE
jgi:hypothetical protein